MWRGLMLPANIVIFSTYFLMYNIKQEKSAEFLAALGEEDPASADMVYERLAGDGIWSIERMLDTPRAEYHPTLSVTRSARQQIAEVKEAIRTKYYTRLWLTDRGLEKFLSFEQEESLPPLDQMAYWYPGQINEAINSYTLDVSERHVMKDGVHRFKAAMSKLRLRTDDVIIKLLEYDRKFAREANHFSPEAISEFIRSRYLDGIDQEKVAALALMLVFVLGNHYLVLKGVPSSVPGASNIILSMILFYVHPEFGRFNIYVILLYRVAIIDPIKTLLLYTLALETWMVAANTLRDNYNSMFLLSVLPTAIFAICLKALKFQPVVVRNPKTKALVVSITGHGYVEEQVQKLYRTQQVPWLSRILLGLDVEPEFEWDEMETLRVQDCDVSITTISQLIKPSLASGKLKNLLIVDNRCLTDGDVKKLVECLKKNGSIEKLGVSFRVFRSIVERLYHWVFWDSCANNLTSDSILFILKWATGRLAPNKKPKSKSDLNESSKLLALDLQGIEVNDECIAHAKHLKINNDIHILCTKVEFLRRGSCLSKCNCLLTKLLCAFVVIFYISIQSYLMFNGTQPLIDMVPEKVWEKFSTNS